MQFELDLEKHCIETALKRLHNRLISEYFKAKGAGPEIEKRIEVIGRVLTELDFSALRTRFPDLAGHTGSAVFLHVDANGRPRITIDGEKIAMPSIATPSPPQREGLIWSRKED